MGSIVGQVIEKLRQADIRADEAYPGGRIPALTGIAGAVRLGKIDRSVRTTAVQVVVMSPARAGGTVCEQAALRAVEVLQEMGGTCVKDICRFDEMADVFYIEMEVTFFGTEKEDGWSAGPGYTVAVATRPLEHVVKFSAGRSIGGDVTDLSGVKWEFIMEEQLPPEAVEPPDPAEPFSITVTRVSGRETFTGCRWTSVRREETIRGVTQIRQGTATRRGEIGVL